MLPLFYNIKNTIKNIYTLQNIFLQLFACLLTYCIVVSGFDWWYFLSVNSSTFLSYSRPAVSIGSFIPLFGIPIFYIFAKLQKNKKHLIMSWAITQATFLGWCISSLYKSLTGRVQPPRNVISTLVDQSTNWNFGFLKHGIFWGWPSSHTTVAFAMSFALIFLFPKNKKILVLALLYAVYIGIGVSFQIHWFSEFIAGAIIGAIIGTSVGKSFYVQMKTA